MSSFEIAVEKKPDNKMEQEIVGEYNFKEIAAIEPAMISLVEQMKEKIENGEYDTIISDDVGARIPSLAFRKILAEKSPNKKINTFFIAGGHAIPGRENYSDGYDDMYVGNPDEERKRTPLHKKEGQEELERYIRKISKFIKKAILVTEMTHFGKTIMALADYLNDNGVKDFDIASLASSHKDYLQRETGREIYVGSEHMGEKGTIYEKRKSLGGVGKGRKYIPYPKRLADIINSEGRQGMITDEEIDNIYGLTGKETPQEIRDKFNDPENERLFNEIISRDLSVEEQRQINEDILKAREDIDTLVKNIINRIWQ